jgi:hypothetical protein
MMICSNGPSLHEKQEVEKFLLAFVARFKAFKTRVPSNSCGGKRPQRASASKAKSSILSQLSGLENVVFNDFIDDELDSEDVSEQRASASLPDSVPIESEEERAVREAAEMTVLDAVGDYEADPNVMLEEGVSCACVPVLAFACVCVCVCVCVRATSICVRENLHFALSDFCLCVCIQQGRHIVHKFESGWEVGVIKAFDKKGPHAGKFSVKYKDDPNWWTHSLLREGYGKDKQWVLLGLPSRDSD